MAPVRRARDNAGSDRMPAKRTAGSLPCCGFAGAYARCRRQRAADCWRAYAAALSTRYVVCNSMFFLPPKSIGDDDDNDNNARGTLLRIPDNDAQRLFAAASTCRALPQLMYATPASPS